MHIADLPKCELVMTDDEFLCVFCCIAKCESCEDTANV
jgi:hypothetical protein